MRQVRQKICEQGPAESACAGPRDGEALLVRRVRHEVQVSEQFAQPRGSAQRTKELFVRNLRKILPSQGMEFL